MLMKSAVTAIDLTTRLWGINHTNSIVIPEHHIEVYCAGQNLNISNLVFCYDNCILPHDLYLSHTAMKHL